MTESDLMGDLPLTLDLLLRRAVRHFPSKGVRTASPAGTTAVTYPEFDARVSRLMGMLDQLGVARHARVASLCWSTVEHLELYFAVPGSGRVLHTLNPRLRPQQLIDVTGEARDDVLFVHTSLASLAARIAEAVPLRHVVLIDDHTATTPPPFPDCTEVHHYEDLVDAAAPAMAVVTNERQPAMICHTGGTTGMPKGVQYSHRSLVLHAMAITAAGTVGITEHDVVLPIVPMFHANAVGFAHAAVGTGATVVLPGHDLSGLALAALLETEAVTATCGVPTIWASVLPHLANRDLSSLRIILSGASAVPPSLSNSFEQAVGLPLTQIWGMTETSPLGMAATVPSTIDHNDPHRLAAFRSTVGPPVLGVEARVVDDGAAEVPPDGTSSGELEVRGPWVAAAYLAGRSPESFTSDGWLKTGDIAIVDSDRNIKIVDRLKDVIKSGGEWISSIELELTLAVHGSVVEAAVVAIPDDRWGERPVAFIVPADPGNPPPGPTLDEHLRGSVPDWWLPDRYEIIDEIPKTSVGKFEKRALRDLLQPPDR